MKRRLFLYSIFLVLPLLNGCNSNNTLNVEFKKDSYKVGDFFDYNDFKVTSNNNTLTDFKVYLDDELVDDGLVITSAGNFNYTFKMDGFSDVILNLDVLENDTKKDYKIENFTYYELGQNAKLPTLSTTGSLNILVVPMVIKGFEKNATSENLERIKKTFNGTSDDTNFESVKSFYNKSSYNQLDLNFTVTDWFNIDKTPLEIYMEKNRKYENDSGIYYCIDKAVEWYKETYNDDCTKFDSDKDGLIDAIWIVNSAPNYLNYTKYDSKYSSTYWGFTYWDEPNYNLRNIKNPVAMNFSWCTFDFMNQGYGSNGIDAHTYIHETGHLFGLLDYYDTANYYNCPNGNVDMMDFNVGDHSAFSKYSLGWIKPTVIKDSTTIELLPFENNGSSIIIGGKNYNGGAFDEYFTIEYVTPTNLNSKDYNSPYNNVDRKIQGYTKPGIKIKHIDARGSYSLNGKTTLTNDPNLITENYLSNTTSGNKKYDQNSMYLSTIFPKNYTDEEDSTTNPIGGKYKESDDALYFEGDSFEINDTSKYISLMPSKSNKLNKFKESNSNDDILNFSVKVNSITDEKASITIVFND